MKEGFIIKDGLKYKVNKYGSIVGVGVPEPGYVPLHPKKIRKEKIRIHYSREKYEPDIFDITSPQRVDSGNVEFGYELIASLPYAYCLYEKGLLKETISAVDTECLYYFSPRHLINPSSRSWDNMSLVRKMPNMKIHQPSLDWSKFSPPPLKEKYRNTRFVYDKPIICICNRVNIEWNKGVINYFDLTILEKLFKKLKKNYQIVYFNIEGRKEFYDGADPVSIGDFDLARKHGAIVIHDLYKENPDLSFNTLQLMVMANCEAFITMNGGYSILASYMGGTNLIYSVECKELGANINSFYRWYHRFGGSRIIHIDSYDKLYESADYVLVKKKPLVNILLRTSKRPKFFEECIKSIEGQTYKNIRIIVSTDNNDTEKYVVPYKVVPIKCVPNNNIQEPPNDRAYGAIAHYNLYLNDLARQVKDGWVIYMDDDDLFSSPTAVENIVNKIENDDSLVLWRIFSSSRVVPNDSNFGKEPFNCDIGGNSFMFHSKHLPSVNWEPYRRGNFRVASKLYNMLKPVWIDDIYVSTQMDTGVAGLGQQIDKDYYMENSNTTRIDIINSFMDQRGYKSYLEIGVQKGKSFSEVRCKNKVGVDPDPESAATIKKTSDDFFKENKKKFDVIFIDGLHESHQVIKDIENSLLILNDGGVIVMHDCLPTSKGMQEVPRIQRDWTGDVWRAFLHYRNRGDLFMCVVDTDFGCGIIKRGEQIPLSVTAPDYEDFERNKKEWMNIIPVGEFLKRRW